MKVLEQETDLPVPKVPESVTHFKQCILKGRPWFEVLLESIAMWTIPREVLGGREYKYVIQNEAFDWMILAERLCDGMVGVIPAKELEALLFLGKPPIEVSTEQLRRVLGYNKYGGVLNYWYGVVVEDVLHLAVEEEVRKDMVVSGHTDIEDLRDIVFQRLYDDGYSNLVGRFRREMKYPITGPASLTQAKEFTYWLFKLRFKYWDPARVASDTRKALHRMKELRGTANPL